MQLFAYNLASDDNAKYLIWVGVLNVANPNLLDVSFTINNGQKIAVSSKVPFEPLGDEIKINNKVLNHRAIFELDVPSSDRVRVNVFVKYDSEEKQVSLTCKQIPISVPKVNQPSFNILLSSCYYQPNDRSVSLSSIVKAIKPSPDLTVLAGDQVYLDLPSMQNLSTENDKLAEQLGEKYQTNWFSNQFKNTGLADILSHGPIVCLPDDHEYWNNYPFQQVQLNNTHTQSNCIKWKNIAQELYTQYQTSPAQNEGYLRLDIDPISMMFLDGRTYRDDQNEKLFTVETMTAIQGWKQDLLDKKSKGKFAVGLLSSGQVFMMDSPSWFGKTFADKEMINYSQFGKVKEIIETLLEKGIPVIYITGDVHWGRIIKGSNMQGHGIFYEIIASPSRLLDSIIEVSRQGRNEFLDLFREDEVFPKHPRCDGMPNMKLGPVNMEILHKQRGDHVALLRFNQIPNGLSFYVDYICTDPRADIREKNSITKGPFKLQKI